MLMMALTISSAVALMLYRRRYSGIRLLTYKS